MCLSSAHHRDIDMSLIAEHYRKPQEIFVLLERIVLIIINGYRVWMGCEIRGEPVKGSGRYIEPSWETGE